MKAAEPIRDGKQIQAMGEYYLKRGQVRNYAMFLMGIHTALRISDLLRLCWGDVYDYANLTLRGGFTVTESKTHKAKTVALHKEAGRALLMLFAYAGCPRGDVPLFENPRIRGAAISRIQAYRIIRAAAAAIAAEGTISCHSLRKTFGYHAWKGNTPLAVIMEIYNHSSFAVTRRYLGITQDDKNNAYLGLKFA